MSEQLRPLIIDYAEFPIRNATDVELLVDELASIAEDYPGFLPIFRIVNLEDIDGS